MYRASMNKLFRTFTNGRQSSATSSNGPILSLVNFFHVAHLFVADDFFVFDVI